MDEEFWKLLDKLVAESEIVIDRPKGTYHPKHPNMFYALDYGYLSGTSSMDGEGIDVWLGSDKNKQVDAIICFADYGNKDCEIKLLIGCTEEEKQIAYKTHNQYDSMKGILIRR